MTSYKVIMEHMLVPLEVFTRIHTTTTPSTPPVQHKNGPQAWLLTSLLSPMHNGCIAALFCTNGTPKASSYRRGASSLPPFSNSSLSELMAYMLDSPLHPARLGLHSCSPCCKQEGLVTSQCPNCSSDLHGQQSHRTSRHAAAHAAVVSTRLVFFLPINSFVWSPRLVWSAI
jgi:hypothetical protein